jgi:phosphoglycolate phosphatase-like HAD superfamily hydrolase
MAILDTISVRPNKIIAYGDTRRHKPQPEPILLAAQQLQVPIECCVVIGDNEIDYRASQRAGSRFIGVSWGELTKREMQEIGVIHVVDSPSEIVMLLTPNA